MNKEITRTINWDKMSGLVPAVIQDINTNNVLMLGFVNKESLTKTIETSKVWFFSRTKNRLWLKGEESKNYLNVEDILFDCDSDSLLIKVIPAGPTCHTGNYSCFNEKPNNNLEFLSELYSLIVLRKKELPSNSYTSKLFTDGFDRIIQKVGEEAIEVIIAAKNESEQRLIEESSDLLFHLMILLVEKNISLYKIIEELQNRNLSNTNR